MSSQSSSRVTATMMAGDTAGHTSWPQAVQRFEMSVCCVIGAPQMPQ